jgi:hypothetical protein
MKDVLLLKIKKLSDEFKMELDWFKLNKADIEELERVLGMIKRIYLLR